MAKTAYLKVRLEPAEFAEFARQAAAMGMSKSHYARLLLTSSPRADFHLTTDQRLAKIEETLAKVGTTFDALLDKLTELIRIPTFREYRSRMLAEGNEMRPGEDERTYLLRIATQYHTRYGVWPNPRNERTFGPGVPDDFPLARG